MKKFFSIALLMLSVFTFGCGDEEESLTINIYGNDDFIYDTVLDEKVYIVNSDDEFEVQYDVGGYYNIAGDSFGLLQFEESGKYKFELLRNESDYDPYAYIYSTANAYQSSDTKILLDSEGDSVSVTVSAGDYVGICLGFRGPNFHREDPECSVKVTKIQ